MNDSRSLLSVNAIYLAAEIQELAAAIRKMNPCEWQHLEDACALPSDTCLARTHEVRRWRGGCGLASEGWERLSQYHRKTTCFLYRGWGPRSRGNQQCVRGDE